MKITLECEFQIGQTVYSKTDPDQMKALVTGFNVSSLGVTSYDIAIGLSVSTHYAIELRTTRDEVSRLM